MKRSLCIVTFVLLLWGCTEEVPVERTVGVVVDRVTLEPYQPNTRFVGRLHAREDVAIQAQVTGYLLSRDFKEGEWVEAGKVLYTIDHSEYKAGLARAKADLAAAVANQANAERNLTRGKELLPKGAISRSELDNLTTKKLDADARIASAQAQVTTAEVNLGRTTIKAPISGRIGRSLVSAGDLVGPNSGNLTTLVSVDPIQAVFQVGEDIYIGSIGEIEERNTAALKRIEVSLELTNGIVYPEIGEIDYFANRIDTSTGTLEARALIPNPHGILVPGQYVRVILQDTQLMEGLFIPQASVQSDQQGAFVLSIDANSAVVRRNVELGRRMDDRVLAIKGVNEGDQLVVRGLQQVRPGMIVTTTPIPSEVN